VNEVARQLPHLEGIHLKNTAIYGKEQNNCMHAFIAWINGYLLVLSFNLNMPFQFFSILARKLSSFDSNLVY
jgi:hypothetical protein